MTIVLAPTESADDVVARGNAGCPGCGGELRWWGWARSRLVRGPSGERRYRPRRVRCRSCGATQVVLPPDVLVRRRDHVAVIGAAWTAHAGGAGARRIAAALDVPMETVRGWLRRLRALVRPLDGDGDRERVRRGLHQVMEAGRIQRGADADLWRFVAHRTGGRLLACNTSWPFARLEGAPMP